MEQIVSTFKRLLEPFKKALEKLQKLFESVSKVQIKPKLKYNIVKEIKANSFLRVRKPLLLHCRNNC